MIDPASAFDMRNLMYEVFSLSSKATKNSNYGQHITYTKKKTPIINIYRKGNFMLLYHMKDPDKKKTKRFNCLMLK